MPPLPPYIVSCRAGIFDKTNRQDLSNWITPLQNDGSSPLVAHFHGGLVNEGAGLSIADALQGTYSAAGGRPVFFVWQAGLFETLGQSLPEIAKEPIFQQLVKKVLDQVLKRTGVTTRGSDGLDDPELAKAVQLLGSEEGAIVLQELDTRDAVANREPDQAELEEFKASLELDAAFMQAAEDAIAALQLRVGESATRDARDVVGRATGHPTLMSPDFANDDTGDRGLVSTLKLIVSAGRVLLRVISRFVQKRDHGAYTTTVEEILREFYIGAVGTFVWDQMKAHSLAGFGADGQRYAGTAFLEEIRSLAATGQRRIILIGHSTGAIWICHLLAKAADAQLGLPNDLKFDVILLAPACTFDLFASTVSAHANRIGSVRVFAMKDVLEAKNMLVPVLYPRSLLYFVSGILEREPDKPILGMERYYKNGTPYESMDSVSKVKQFFATRQDWGVWSATADTAVSGPRCDSEDHGEFDNNPLTLESLQHIIRGV